MARTSRLRSAGMVMETEEATSSLGWQPQLRNRVLLVEDEPVNSALTTLLLERLGCRVVHAATGVEAVRAVLGQTFDLVLMDCQMPEMDGWTATRIIRHRGSSSAAGTELPIIAQTATGRPEDIALCETAGMNGILNKPIDLQSLDRLVRRYCEVPTAA